jgi:polar amino acid transport system permease protein
VTGPRGDLLVEPEEPGKPPTPTHRGGSRLLGNRGFLISTASTIVFFGVLIGVFLLAPGSKAVRETFFNLDAMKASFFGDPSNGVPAVWKAFFVNVAAFSIAEVLILIFALVLALIRLTPGPVMFPLRIVAIAYVDFFRGVPLLLLFFLFDFGFPALEIRGLSDQSAFVYGLAALVVSYSAYVSEVYRAGIESVHPSQAAAARSLGLSRWKAMRFVVLPQAIRRIIPPLLNDFVSLQKDTALLAVIGVGEAVRAANIYSLTTFNFSSLILVAFMFVLLTIPLARFTDHLIDRDRRRRAAMGAV